MRGWQAKKRRTCALPVDKGYARKCKTTRSAGGYLLTRVLNYVYRKRRQSENLESEHMCKIGRAEIFRDYERNRFILTARFYKYVSF